MKVYIHAFDPKGKIILGNLEGQGIIEAKVYRRTNAYKALSTYKTLNNKVAHYEIQNRWGNTLETVKNTTHRSQ